jgi:hypothetical protein
MFLVLYDDIIHYLEDLETKCLAPFTNDYLYNELDLFGKAI